MAVVRCLQLPEIVRSVCDESTKSASLSIALTCRSLLEPALDSLWRDIYSFNAIAAALPRDLWHWQRRTNSNDSIPVVSFKRGMKGQDLERYLTFYARRIRRLAPVLSSKDKIFSIEFFQSLQMVTGYHTGVLTPCLKDLHWLPFGHALVWLGHDFCRLLPPYISLFLGDSVARFVAFDYGLHPHPTLLSFVTNCLQNLKELDLRALATNRVIGISDDCWSRVERLKIGSGTGDILANLAHSILPARLRSLHLESHSDTFFPTHSTPPRNISSFPSLQVVSVRTSALTEIPKLLDYLICQDNVVAAFVCMIKPCEYPPEIWQWQRRLHRNLGRSSQHIISHIDASCNRQTLQRLSITELGKVGVTEPQANDSGSDTLEEDEDEDDGPVIRRPRQVIVFSNAPIDIQPLYNFHKLKVLDIRLHRVCIPVGPDDILAISTAWPSLEVLNLCPDFPCLRRLPSINHNHIIQLLDSCPSLREVGLRFDTTQITKRDVRSVPAKQYPQLRILQVGDSPISYYQDVIGFLRMYFPRLEELHTIAIGPARPNMTTWEQEWLAVLEGSWKAGPERFDRV